MKKPHNTACGCAWCQVDRIRAKLAKAHRALLRIRAVADLRPAEYNRLAKAIEDTKP